MKAIKTINWRQTRATKRIKIKRPDTDGLIYSTHTHKSEHTISQLLDSVEVFIDAEGIINELGCKAAHNNSGRAVALRGLIKAKRISRKVLSEEKQAIPIPQGYVEVTE